jgi:hypothetical protein
VTPIARCALISLSLSLCVCGNTVAADPHQGRPPSGGTGSPGAETLDEGTQAGAPGNIVTATEGTVLQAQDGNSDGFVDREEARSNGDLARQFARLDTNHDQRLDAGEFQAYTPAASAVTGTAPTTPRDATSGPAARPRSSAP